MLRSRETQEVGCPVKTVLRYRQCSDSSRGVRRRGRRSSDQRRKEKGRMSSLVSVALVLPLLPGKEEVWRRFYQELAGTRRAEYEQSRRKLGITREQAWIVQTHQGELLIACLEVEHMLEMLPRLLVSDL